MSKSKINSKILTRNRQSSDPRVAGCGTACDIEQRPGDDDTRRSESYRAFLSKHWPIVAALAWGEFVERGRGALVMHNVDFPNDDATYLPMDSLSDPLMTPCRQMVAEYDPNREVVAVFLNLTRGVSLFKYAAGEGMLTPPEAYKHLGPLLFEP